MAVLVPESRFYMNEQAVAAYLGISWSTLGKWRRRGVGCPRYTRLGRRTIRYLRSDVERWAQQQALGERTSGEAA
jgi:predicted DNA-binding transcriptional regulator AlpA